MVGDICVEATPSPETPAPMDAHLRASAHILIKCAGKQRVLPAHNDEYSESTEPTICFGDDGHMVGDICAEMTTTEALTTMAEPICCSTTAHRLPRRHGDAQGLFAFCLSLFVRAHCEWCSEHILGTLKAMH